MVANLALLGLEVLLLGGAVLALHRLSPRYGLTPLIAFVTGLTVFVQAANATLVYVRLSSDFYVVLAATVYVPIILLAVLILYVVEGTVPARLTIFSILGVSTLYFLLLLSSRLHLFLPAGGSFMGLTPDSPFITPDLRSTLASLTAFAVDLFIIAIVYQGIKNHAPRLPAWLGPGLALMISLWSDTILYQILAYGMSGDFLAAIADDVLGKTLVGLMLWPLAALYLIRVAPGLPGFRGVESRRTFDLLLGARGGMEAALARSEAARHESEALYQSLVEILPMSVCRKDLDGRFTFVNQRYCNEFKQPASEIVGKTDYDLHPADLAEKYQQDDRAVIAGGQTVEWVEEHEPLGGERTYVQAFKSPVFDAQGRANGVQIIFWDVTERRRADMELARERDLLQALMDSMPDAIYFKDAASSFTRINRAQASLLGIATPDAAVGKTDFDFFPADLCQMYFQEEQQLVQTGQPVLDRQEFNPTPAGQPRWLAATKAPRRDAAGRIVGLVGVTRDVTDRVLAQERANTTSRGLRAVIELAHELIGCADFDTFCRRAVELARDRLEVERCGLFLLDARGILRGTYGTDLQRQTTDERAAQFPPAYRVDFDVAPQQLWTILESDQTYYGDMQRKVVGAGWIGSTLIRRRERTIGVMYNDTAINHAPVNEAQQEVLAVYCSLLGSLIELKRVEETLQMFQYTIDRASDAVQWLNREGGFEYVNDQACRTLGYTREEFMRLRLWDIDPAYPQERWVANWESYQPDRRGGSEIIETLYHRKDGSGFPVEVLSNHIWFGDKELHVAVVRDITERKQAEQIVQLRLKLMMFAATRSLEELLQKTLDEVEKLTNSSIGFFHFVEADQRTLSLQAWSTRTLAEFCQAEGKGRHYPIDEAGVWTDCVRERRPVIHNDYSSLPHRKGLPEGHAQVARELVVPMLRGDRIVAILGVGNKAQAYTDKDVEIVTYAADLAWEITERKQAEEALQESEEKYRRLVEISPVAMWINQDGIITYMNPAALRILGAADLQQVVGRKVLDFIHPGYHAAVKARIAEMVDREQIVPLLEEKYVRLDGSVVDVEVTATPFMTAKGRAMQVLFQDITERKRAEAERERLIAELENKNAELERFTYTASHDLKSPLVTIRGFLGFVEKDAESGDLDQLKTDIARIRNAADRMQRLLNELLELSRIGRMMNPPEEVPMAVIVREAVELVQGRLEAHGVQLDIQPDLPIVYGDRTRLVEVVQNLVDNACKFMDAQPVPLVTIGQRGTDRDGRPILFVRDNGIGIDRQYQQKVFGLFDKLDPKSEGTGIGLALVKRIVEVHGGRVWVESEGADVKSGSTFYFTLPVKSDV